MRKLLSITTIIAAGLISTVAHADEKLTVYSSRSEPLIQSLLEKFTEETQIETQILTDDAPKLIARMESEGDATPADVFLPADVSNMANAADKGLLQAVDSEILLANVPAEYRDADNKWFGLGKRVRAIIYNKEKVNPETDLSTYEDLADPKWEGQILARTSSHPYNLSLIAAIIAADGSEKAETWVNGIVANLARPPQGGDRDQIKAVAAGEGTIAIANSYYYALLLNSEVPEEKAAAEATGIYFPNQNAGEGELSGAHVNLSGAGVTTYSDSPENAIKLIEFLSSPEAQRIYADANQEYPVNPNVEPSETLKSFGEFKPDSTPLHVFVDNIEEAIQITDRSGWK